MNVNVEDVSYAYAGGVRAVCDVTLNVASGSSLALIGPNGSGKSTLLRLISGVLTADQGSVQLGGQPLGTLSPRRIARHLAMVDQERSMGFDFTVREVVAMGRIAHRARFSQETSRDHAIVARALGLADVERLAERSIRAISGGERQRVYLALALAQEPEVLLLDEPTTYLDLQHQARFMSVVQDRLREGMTVLTAIHDLTLAAQTADRIAMIKNGRIEEKGTATQVLTPSNIRRVFDVDASVGRDPTTGALYVVSSLRSARAAQPGSQSQRATCG